MSIKMLKDKVEHCLEKYPDTRNSDIALTIAVWHEYYNNNILNIDGELLVKLKDLYELPREDNIKRIRAKFQNEKKQYLPTDPIVRKKRRILEDEWRSNLGYNNPSMG